VIAATALALPAFAFPGLALAQGTANPLSPGLPQPSVSLPTTTAPTVTATSTSSGSGSGFSGSSAIIIAIGAFVVLGGISLFIWRDARRRAPARHRMDTRVAEGGRAATKRPQKPRKLSPAERKRRKRGRAR
jgi:hypothetical protein